MVRLVDDLLDVSRISRGKLELRLRAAHAGAGAGARAGGQPAGAWTRPATRWRCDLPPQPVPLHGDLTRLAQVVSNLVNNAAKYTPAGGRIVRERRRPRTARRVLQVRDNGAGIAPDMLPQVFDLFAQGERHADSAQGGLGIGLWLVQQAGGAAPRQHRGAQRRARARAAPSPCACRCRATEPAISSPGASRTGPPPRAARAAGRGRHPARRVPIPPPRP